MISKEKAQELSRTGIVKKDDNDLSTLETMFDLEIDKAAIAGLFNTGFYVGPNQYKSANIDTIVSKYREAGFTIVWPDEDYRHLVMISWE